MPQKAPPDDIIASEIAIIEKILGRNNTEIEREMMRKGLVEKQANAKAVRTSPLIRDYDPAFVFDARLPDTILPKPGVKVSLSKAKTLRYSTITDNPESLAFASVSELGRLVKNRKVTSFALTQMYLGRLKKYDPQLFCVVNLCEERALHEATEADREIASGKYRGPLHGIPYGLKDLFAATDTKTTYGATPYKDQILDYDATVTARLREAGAVLIAKLSMGELAMGDVWFGGKTRTPWDVSKGSSSSSAGSASAVAAGLVGFALGTETLGSIVSPCRNCGTTGLRPTFGRVSRQGAMALSWTMDKIGPICRSVEDCALVFATILGPDGHDRTVVPNVGFSWEPHSNLSKLRVGFVPALFEKAAPAQKAALETLKSLGIILQPVTLPKSNPAYSALTDLIISVEGAASFSELIETGGLRELAQQDDWNWPNAFRVAANVSAADYINAQRVRRHLQHAMNESLKEVDVYVVPSGPSLNLAYQNLCGQPTVITRCGFTEKNLPVMIEFCGNLFREDAALRLAFAYEQAAGVYQKTPTGFESQTLL
jgi:Asp-tRNA(Asn)/Glu-tRNA(Gln) amidotransferase A subunit family amidase